MGNIAAAHDFNVRNQIFKKKRERSFQPEAAPIWFLYSAISAISC